MEPHSQVAFINKIVDARHLNHRPNGSDGASDHPSTGHNSRSNTPRCQNDTYHHHRRTADGDYNKNNAQMGFIRGTPTTTTARNDDGHRRDGAIGGADRKGFTALDRVSTTSTAGSSDTSPTPSPITMRDGLHMSANSRV